MSEFKLAYSTYGKDNVRVLKVWKDPKNPQIQNVIEMTVRCLLEGDVEESYTKADNSPIVPTDTVKNTVYVLAKQTDTWPIERFASTLANHFITRYSHIHGANVYIKQHRWTKYAVNGKLHPHSFIQDGRELRTCEVYKKSETSPFVITSGIKDLTVLKSTGSMFYDFHRCEYTTLKDTKDRILSTDVDATWVWNPAKFNKLEDVYAYADKGIFDTIYNQARTITLNTFALENSASVQATMYNISTEILSVAPDVEFVNYALPNKHYMNIDLSWHKGIKNLGKDQEVFLPSSDPNGLIKSTVTRSSKAKL